MKCQANLVFISFLYSFEYYIFADKLFSNKKEAEHIQDLLKLTGDEIYQKHGLKRDETICNTAVFPNGVEMDIKLVICEGESYPYTEAILYDNGVEVDFTEPCDEYIDEWELEDEMNDVKYIVVVEVEE